MNIALLSEKYTPDIGGLAISTERLARLLTSAGHDVRVFAPTLNLPPSEKQTRPSSGVSVTRFGAHKRVDDTLVDWTDLITGEHNHEPFGVLHAYFLSQAGFVATYAGKYLNLPSVVSIRGNDIDRAAFDPARFSHTLYALQHANVVTANASESVKKAKAFLDREIIFIPNGVEVEHFKPMERNEGLAEALGLKSLESDSLLSDVVEHTLAGTRAPRLQNQIIGFVGELREKKGLAILLSAFALVNKKQPVALLVVGEVRQGDDKKYFEEFKASHPDLNIILTGYISPKDLPAYYSLIDIFVHPSFHDGMPNAVLEAMACGKAVVATGVGGVPDVIKDRENGSIVPVNDAESLSNAIIELLKDESLRNRLGKSARETIVKKFSPQRELDANLTIYKKLGSIS